MSDIQSAALGFFFVRQRDGSCVSAYKVKNGQGRQENRLRLQKKVVFHKKDKDFEGTYVSSSKKGALEAILEARFFMTILVF